MKGGVESGGGGIQKNVAQNSEEGRQRGRIVSFSSEALVMDEKEE